MTLPSTEPSCVLALYVAFAPVSLAVPCLNSTSPVAVTSPVDASYSTVSALSSAGSLLLAADIWPKVKAWIESVPGAYDLYLAAEDISEDEPLLAQGIAAVKELLGWTDEQVAAVLDAAVVGGGA